MKKREFLLLVVILVIFGLYAADSLFFSDFGITSFVVRNVEKANLEGDQKDTDVNLITGEAVGNENPRGSSNSPSEEAEKVENQVSQASLPSGTLNKINVSVNVIG